MREWENAIENEKIKKNEREKWKERGGKEGGKQIPVDPSGMSLSFYYFPLHHHSSAISALRESLTRAALHQRPTMLRVRTYTHTLTHTHTQTGNVS